MPNSGRCELGCLCIRLYLTDGRSDRQFNIVIRIGDADFVRIFVADLHADAAYRSANLGQLSCA